MADIEKVMKGLECCGKKYPRNAWCKYCPYEPDCYHDSTCDLLIRDALDLLKFQKIAIDQFMKEQKAKEPVIFGDGATFEEAKNFWYACAVCKNPLDFCDNFCRKCGAAIDWEGTKKDGDGD